MQHMTRVEDVKNVMM